MIVVYVLLLAYEYVRRFQVVLFQGYLVPSILCSAKGTTDVVKITINHVFGFATEA